MLRYLPPPDDSPRRTAENIIEVFEDHEGEERTLVHSGESKMYVVLSFDAPNSNAFPVSPVWKYDV
jgi:hypothetical protein